ncbi:MAG: hypothetical protein ACLGI9_10820 [Thermoanaerobaculia bacterium]
MPMNILEFIQKWSQVSLTERSASQQHFLDLCGLVRQSRRNPELFRRFTAELFQAMAVGDYWALDRIRHFNGNLFNETPVLTLTVPELESITEAAKLDWSAVDPSIFGTLFAPGAEPGARRAVGRALGAASTPFGAADGAFGRASAPFGSAKYSIRRGQESLRSFRYPIRALLVVHFPREVLHPARGSTP